MSTAPITASIAPQLYVSSSSGRSRFNNPANHPAVFAVPPRGGAASVRIAMPSSSLIRAL
ncbi:MAG: hypothetical protein C0504_16730 [Candidatus Solibacter sp.]|nr:hypothetical protein [Candidatus Solibacter sp.]